MEASNEKKKKGYLFIYKQFVHKMFSKFTQRQKKIIGADLHFRTFVNMYELYCYLSDVATEKSIQQLKGHECRTKRKWARR